MVNFPINIVYKFECLLIIYFFKQIFKRNFKIQIYFWIKELIMTVVSLTLNFNKLASLLIKGGGGSKALFLSYLT